MAKLLITTFFIGATLASCASHKIYSPEEIQAICEEERAEAAGVQGKVSVGVNNQTGTNLGIQLSVNDKFLRGLDPQAVYDQCVQEYNDLNLSAKTNQAE